IEEILDACCDLQVRTCSNDRGRNVPRDLIAKLGPDRAAHLPCGSIVERMPHMVSPVSYSIPLVTLTISPSYCPNPFATSRKPLDGTAITTHSEPAIA